MQLKKNDLKPFSYQYKFGRKWAQKQDTKGVGEPEIPDVGKLNRRKIRVLVT